MYSKFTAGSQLNLLFIPELPDQHVQLTSSLSLTKWQMNKSNLQRNNLPSHLPLPQIPDGTTVPSLKE